MTPDPWALLLDTARRATERSHAPYSGVPVGAAAAETTDSRVLEGSNTDIADEFTKLIVTQQAYSANTKVITTSNQMVQDLLNVLR